MKKNLINKYPMSIIIAEKLFQNNTKSDIHRPSQKTLIDRNHVAFFWVWESHLFVLYDGDTIMALLWLLLLLFYFAGLTRQRKTSQSVR